MAIEVDLDLVGKYNRPGPRYTSYPTALNFNESVGSKKWLEQIKLNNRDNSRELSLYIHLPFCDTLCWFCGCTTIITRKREKIDEYLKVLHREIDLVTKYLNRERKVIQMHFGGGTPTSLLPDQIRKLGSYINENFTFADDVEVGSEMDPRDLTEEHIQALKEVGFNRLSMGVQDFDPKVQKAVNRINSFEMVTNVVTWIRKAGVKSLNLDLIYGLPHQTCDTFEKTLDDILKIDPDRLAVFNYAHVPWMKPHQKLIKEADLPPPEEKCKMLKMIVERLTSSGYVYIGMDHFAKETDELAVAQKEKTLQRNFQGYSTKAGADIYAFGMSSISQLQDIYVQNFKELPLYYDRIRSTVLPIEKGYLMSNDDKIRRYVIMELMCNLGVDLAEVSRHFDIDVPIYFQKELRQMEPFEEDGLLIQEPDRITVTEKGRLFIRNIAMEFDAYLGKFNTRYSKTV